MHQTEKRQLVSEGDVNVTPFREQWNREHLSDSTRDVLEEDARYFLHQSLSTPCLNALNRVEGSILSDWEGRPLLDFHGNNVHQVGFSHPKVVAAIKSQLDGLSFCPRRYTNRPAIDLAKRLTSMAPGDLNRVLFAPGGTSAIGMALKLARVATGRFKTISMWDSFHGASLDAISIGGEAVFRQGMGPLLPGCEHAPPPDHRHCPFKCGSACNLNCAGYVDYMLEKEGDVAAVIAETVRCTPYVPPKEYWQRIRRSCDRHGALLILDEIPIGLGRTGRMFAFEHYDIVPDMVVLGKGLGGGVFPLAALIAHESLNRAGHMALGHYTHEKNPVACAAGLATLEIIESEGLLEAAEKKGRWLMGRLSELQQECPETIGEVRGIGLLIGMELVMFNGERNCALAEKVMYGCLTRGLNFKITMGNILTLTPPLVISYEELERAFQILREVILQEDHASDGRKR